MLLSHFQCCSWESNCYCFKKYSDFLMNHFGGCLCTVFTRNGLLFAYFAFVSIVVNNTGWRALRMGQIKLLFWIPVLLLYLVILWPLVSELSFLYHDPRDNCVHVLVTQLCLTLRDPIDCRPPGSSVHGILPARILEWVAIPFSGGSSWPRIEPVSLISPALAGKFFTIWATKEALIV